MFRSAEGARLARSTGAIGGLIVIALGLWGALIPFVGPYFGYGFGAHASWHYSENRLWLDILPGVVAVAAGAMMLGASTRRAGLVAGGLGLAAGAWFVVGPSVAITWEHSAIGPIGTPIGGYTRETLEYIGFFYGVGALTVALAAFASGRFISRPLLAQTPVVIAAYRGARFDTASYDGDPEKVPADDATAEIAAYRGARLDAGTYNDVRATSASDAPWATTGESVEAAAQGGESVAVPGYDDEPVGVPEYDDAATPVAPAPSETAQRTQRGWLSAAMAPVDDGARR